MEASKQSYTLAEAARLIGVAPITLKRWLLLAKVGEVARDRNGWRVFSDQDIERIRTFAQRITPAEDQ
jgi:DNA-binding transcriptional MerR regulator